jgi:hypothetical protein
MSVPEILKRAEEKAAQIENGLANAALEWQTPLAIAEVAVQLALIRGEFEALRFVGETRLLARDG